MGEANLFLLHLPGGRGELCRQSLVRFSSHPWMYCHVVGEGVRETEQDGLLYQGFYAPWGAVKKLDASSSVKQSLRT